MDEPPKNSIPGKNCKSLSTSLDQIQQSVTTTEKIYKPQKSIRKKKRKRNPKITYWKNILQDCRIIISYQPWNIHQPFMNIEFACQNFAETFIYPSQTFGSGTTFLFRKMIGPSTDSKTVSNIENSIRSGIIFYDYINLYRSDRVIIACHMIVTPLTHCLDDPNHHTGERNDPTKKNLMEEFDVEMDDNVFSSSTDSYGLLAISDSLGAERIGHGSKDGEISLESMENTLPSSLTDTFHGEESLYISDDSVPSTSIANIPSLAVNPWTGSTFYASMVIRSASSVGNTQQLNFGLVQKSYYSTV